MPSSSINIALFASGTGSNARCIIDHLHQKEEIRVALVLSNKKEAGVLAMARERGVETLVVNRAEFYDNSFLLQKLKQKEVSWIFLAGFLWLLPDFLIQAYPGRIVNIHPALLPKYGGKGMYGMNVHRAVEASGDKQSGPTIHYVNEKYDEGAIIFQAARQLAPTDKAAVIAKKVLELEHQYYPLVVESLINNSTLPTQ